MWRPYNYNFTCCASSGSFFEAKKFSLVLIKCVFPVIDNIIVKDPVFSFLSSNLSLKSIKENYTYMYAYNGKSYSASGDLDSKFISSYHELRKIIFFLNSWKEWENTRILTKKVKGQKSNNFDADFFYSFIFLFIWKAFNFNANFMFVKSEKCAWNTSSINRWWRIFPSFWKVRSINFSFSLASNFTIEI